MQELDDNGLLRQYAEQNSEEAFAAIVSRHINKVYSTALRHTRNPGQAEEITQAVFVILARKAHGLSKRVILSGWLYQTARLTSVTYLRSEIRRARREEEAHMQNILNEPALDETWTQIAPLLDEAMAGLNETDRNAVVLRFFDGKSIREVGSALGTTEDAAKKRLSRALEKLQRFFAKRGVHSTTAIIAGTISSNSVHVAPAALAKSVMAVAMAHGVTAGGTTLTLVKGVLKVMAWSKAIMMGGIVVLLAAGTITVTIAELKKSRANEAWRSVIHFNRPSTLDADLENTPPQVAILPTIHPDWGAIWWWDGSGRMLGINSSVVNLLDRAYCAPPSRVTLLKLADTGSILTSLGFLPTTRIVFLQPAPTGNYDFISNLPNGSEAALQQKIREQFGLTAHKEIRNTQVWIVTVGDAYKLKTIANTSGHSLWDPGYGELKMNDRISRLAGVLQSWFHVPVIDLTGTHKSYDFNLRWDVHDKSTRISMITNELNAVGLELVYTNMPTEILVVEKAE